MHDDEGFVLEALANGVSAYVLKDSNSSDLVQAVREVAAGRRYLSPPLSDRAIGTYQQMAKIGTMDSHERLLPANAKYCSFRLKATPTVKSPPV